MKALPKLQTNSLHLHLQSDLIAFHFFFSITDRQKKNCNQKGTSCAWKLPLGQITEICVGLYRECGQGQGQKKV